jgi:hypothetical protein
MSEHRLNEIVIERPRGGSRISSKSIKGTKKMLNKLTEEAGDDGLFRPYLIKVKNKTKWLSDHLGPLRRLLHSKVGQPWNDVYHEICQRLDRNTTLGQHVIDHVWDYVERDIEMIDGVPYRKTCAGYRECQLLNRWRCSQLYIHPETGVLCLVERSRKSPLKETQRQDIVEIDRDRYYRNLNGIWYEITFCDFPSLEKVRDAIFKEFITPQIAWKEYDRKVYAASKRQCSKREIKTILAKLHGGVAQRREQHSSKVSCAGSNPAVLVMGL